MCKTRIAYRPLVATYIVSTIGYDNRECLSIYRNIKRYMDGLGITNTDYFTRLPNARVVNPEYEFNSPTMTAGIIIPC